MKVLFHFFGNIYDCEIIIRDASGTKSHIINLETADQSSQSVLEADVASGNFELTVIPRMGDYRSALEDMETQTWKDKLAQKIGKSFFSMIDQMLLRVGCTYVISNAKENDVIQLHSQEYVFCTFDKYDLFELIPMMYMFFEASKNGVLCKCTNAFPTNRKEVISNAKKLVLVDFGLHLIFTYPIQVGRIKRLSSDKKVKETLIEFNGLSESERQRVLNKQEKFMS